MLFNIEPRGRGGAGVRFLIKFFVWEVACTLAVEPTLNLGRKREGQDGVVGQKGVAVFQQAAVAAACTSGDQCPSHPLHN